MSNNAKFALGHVLSAWLSSCWCRPCYLLKFRRSATLC